MKFYCILACCFVMSHSFDLDIRIRQNDFRKKSSSSALQCAIGDCSLLTGSRKLALKLLKIVSSDPVTGSTNVFISPVSIWQALITLYFGTKGKTAKKLSKVLGLNSNNKSLVAAELNLLNQRYKDATTVDRSVPIELIPNNTNVLRLANRVFIDKGSKLGTQVVDYFGNYGMEGAVREFGFKKHPEESLKAINSWVERQTNRKIKNLFTDGDITNDTELVLANAAYFNGKWSLPFSESKTTEETFFTKPQQLESSKNTVKVPMMMNHKYYGYVYSERYEAGIVEMEFVGSKLSLFAMLPDNSTTVDRVVALLSPAGFRNELKNVIYHNVELHFPKLRVEQSLELKDVLLELGLATLYKDSKVGLSGFTGGTNFELGVVKHKAVIEIMEEGAEAAAATAAAVFPRSGDPVILNFNRPFLFFIRENKMDSILFSGIVRQPNPANQNQPVV